MLSSFKATFASLFILVDVLCFRRAAVSMWELVVHIFLYPRPTIVNRRFFVTNAVVVLPDFVSVSSRFIFFFFSFNHREFGLCLGVSI